MSGLQAELLSPMQAEQERRRADGEQRAELAEREHVQRMEELARCGRDAERKLQRESRR